MLSGIILGPALSVAGCTDYLARRDTLTLETGDAVQANIAVHVIDPSPPLSSRIVHDTDGERLRRGVERYRSPQAGLGGGGGGGVAPVPMSSTTTPSSGNSLSR